MGTEDRQQANVELARSGMADWIEGRREEAIATFADDVEVYVPPELGNAGSYKGVEQFRKWFAAWDEVWSEYSMEADQFDGIGDHHVVLRVHSFAKGAGSGIEVENVLFWVMEIRDGKMVYISLQPDREAALALVAERDPSTG